jgi:hypothetical protein
MPECKAAGGDMNKTLVERMQVALTGTRGVVRQQQNEAGQAFTIRRVDAGKIVAGCARMPREDKAPLPQRLSQSAGNVSHRSNF